MTAYVEIGNLLIRVSADDGSKRYMSQRTFVCLETLMLSEVMVVGVGKKRSVTRGRRDGL